MVRLWIHWTVIVLAILLLICAVVIEVCSTHGSHVNRTAATIKLLEEACRSYRLSYGVFPPGDPTFDSKTLHRHLGRVRISKGPDGSEVLRPPIVEFSSELLLNHPVTFSADHPLPIVDDRNRPIRYANPGIHNKQGIDLWSHGSNADLDPDAPDYDGITNWGRDY